MGNGTTKLSQWLQIALDFIFPAECVYCHGFLGDQRVAIFCRSCWDAIRLITKPTCPKCGQPYPTETVLRYTPHFVCGDCRKTPPFFDRVMAITFYQDVLQEAIQQFKFHHKTSLGKPLAHLMLTHLTPDVDLSPYQAILPVPLHKIRQRQRGYNQAAILAKILAQHFHLPLLTNNLIRIRHTHSQALLKGRKERQENVKNAFQVVNPSVLQDKQVILVDDVMTTGATVNECAKTLKQAGVKSVLVLALSRAGRS
jgi:ComF family protein